MRCRVLGAVAGVWLLSASSLKAADLCESLSTAYVGQPNVGFVSLPPDGGIIGAKGGGTMLLGWSAGGYESVEIQGTSVTLSIPPNVTQTIKVSTFNVNSCTPATPTAGVDAACDASRKTFTLVWCQPQVPIDHLPQTVIPPKTQYPRPKFLFRTRTACMCTRGSLSGTIDATRRPQVGRGRLR